MSNRAHHEPASAPTDADRDEPSDPAALWERRLAVPVLLAAVVSVPAVFLTTVDGAVGTAGMLLNYASGVVLVGEAVVLMLVARDTRRWLADNKVIVAVAVATVPAVFLALGPVQLLRLVRFVGALRVLRAGRIMKAGRILRERADLEGPVRNAIAIGVTVLAATFVALVLADPSSTSRQLIADVLGRFGIAPIALAAVILAVATFVVLRYRNERSIFDDDEPPSDRRADRTG